MKQQTDEQHKGKIAVESSLLKMEKRTSLQLDDGSQIAVIGGGPAGSFFSYFLLDMAQRVGIDIYENLRL